jgi:hypothetical protein
VSIYLLKRKCSPKGSAGGLFDQTAAAEQFVNTRIKQQQQKVAHQREVQGSLALKPPLTDAWRVFSADRA